MVCNKIIYVVLIIPAELCAPARKIEALHEIVRRGRTHAATLFVVGSKLIPFPRPPCRQITQDTRQNGGPKLAKSLMFLIVRSEKSVKKSTTYSDGSTLILYNEK